MQSSKFRQITDMFLPFICYLIPREKKPLIIKHESTEISPTSSNDKQMFKKQNRQNRQIHEICYLYL